MTHAELFSLANTAIQAFGAFLLGVVTLLIRSHVKNKTAADALVSLTNLAGHVVGQLEQTTVADIKAKNAWNSDTAKTIKSDAVSILRKTGAQFLAALGLDPAGPGTQRHVDIGVLLETLLESAVQKLRGPQTSPSANPPVAVPKA